MKTFSDIKIENDFSRPWGSFTKFIDGKRCTVKILRIKTGESLSLQLHQKRNEFWYVISGKIKVALGKPKGKLSYRILSKDQFVFIHKKSLHRAAAIKSAVILEISLGNFDENDIVRYKDKYGRA